MRHFTEYPPLTLYVHFPWCIRKCPYCDFNSHATRDQSIPERQYLEAVVADLEQHAPDIWGRPVESVFFGGGTPSLMTAEGLDYLMGKIRAIVKLEPAAEITLEANPGTVEQQRFKAYRESGVNRLSIGIQSFNDVHLKTLGRIHGREEAITACETAIAAGFDNFNIDLMHGLPEQSIEDAVADIATALSLAPTHISYYQLTLEPNTLFAARPPILPDEDTLWSIQQQCKQQLAHAGFEQYEVSAYAKPKKQCHHNLNYWLFGDYLGVGAGAHSKLSFPANNTIVRHSKHKHPTAYMTAAHSNDRIQNLQLVDRPNTRLEFMMNALRLNNGFSTDEFTGRTGEPLHVLKKALAEAEQNGLIHRDISRVMPTPQGLQYLDTLLQSFMPADAESAATTIGQVIPIAAESKQPQR